MAVGHGDLEKAPERSNKAIRYSKINNLTEKTNPNQSQIKATKSFRFECGPWEQSQFKATKLLITAHRKKQSHFGRDRGLTRQSPLLDYDLQ